MPASEPLDDRLRELLAVERRLQQRIGDARTSAERRIADARRASERLLDGLDTAIAEADVEAARHDEAAYDAARRALETRHQAAVDAFSSISDAQIERLTRRMLDRLLESEGGLP